MHRGQDIAYVSWTVRVTDGGTRQTLWGGVSLR
jgi:hypothetical protein